MKRLNALGLVAFVAFSAACSKSGSKAQKENRRTVASALSTPDLSLEPVLEDHGGILSISWNAPIEQLTVHYKICNAADCTTCNEAIVGLSPLSIEKDKLPFQGGQNHFCFNSLEASGTESGFTNLLSFAHAVQSKYDQEVAVAEQSQVAAPLTEPVAMIVPTIVVSSDKIPQPTKKEPEAPLATADTTPPTHNSIAIENGSDNAYRKTAQLNFSSTGAFEMYITNTPGCDSEGSWEAYRHQKSEWPLLINNGQAVVYVKFRDLANNETPCLSDSIAVGVLSAIQSPIRQILAENPDDVRWIRYKLKDASGQNRALGAKFEYSTDGVAFLPMTDKSIPNHENPSNLSSSIEGEVHYFAWDIHKDFGASPTSNATIRLTPYISGDQEAVGMHADVINYNFDTRKRVINRAQNYILDYSAFTETSVANLLAQNPDMVVMQIAAPVATTGHTFERIEQLKLGHNPLDASDDVLVFAYTSANEDLRTTLFTNDDRNGDRTTLYSAITSANPGDPLYKFKGDGSGPSIDPRENAPFPHGDPSSIATLSSDKFVGKPTNKGFAPYYLDDVDTNNETTDGLGLPDRNIIFGGFFVNSGHPQWYQDMKASLLSEHDDANSIKGAAGFDELLTYFTGGGYHVDGLMIDTIDSLSPNGWNDQANSVEFEWASKGTMVNYFGGLKRDFPSSLLMVNRGLFFFNPNVSGHFALDAGRYFDAVVFESYASDNGDNEFYNENYYEENKHYVSKVLLAEAQRHDLKVLSIGYINGVELDEETDPNQRVDPALVAQDYDHDIVSSLAGFQFFRDSEFPDVFNMGFLHYVSDFTLTTLNDFYKGFVADDENNGLNKEQGPVFSTTFYRFNASAAQKAPVESRVGVQYGESTDQSATIYWDVATSSKPNVRYEVITATNQAMSENVSTKLLSPEELKNAGHAYGTEDDGSGSVGFMAYPFQYEINNLTNGTEYYFAVRAIDQDGRYDEDQFSNVRNISVTPYTPNTGCTLDFSGCALSFLPQEVDSQASSYVYRAGHNETQAFPAQARKFKSMRMANSATHLFLEIESQGINDDTVIFIDTDASHATGFLKTGIGSDFHIYINNGGVSVNKYSGGDNQGLWSWIWSPNISMWQSENKQHTYLSVPFSELEIDASTDPKTIKLRLKGVNPDQYGLSNVDYPDDLAPKAGAITYVVQSTSPLSQTTIAVDGTLEQEWMSKMSRFANDPDDHDPSVGSDYFLLTATNDDNNLYLLAGGDLEISTSETFVFIDTGDGLANGYAGVSGADYMLQRTVGSESEVNLKLFKYNDAAAASDPESDWYWDEVAAGGLREAADHGETYHEFGVALSDLGITTSSTISIILKYNAAQAADQDVLFLNNFKLIE